VSNRTVNGGNPPGVRGFTGIVRNPATGGGVWVDLRLHTGACGGTLVYVTATP
jgi:hypothetical protein